MECVTLPHYLYDIIIDTKLQHKIPITILAILNIVIIHKYSYDVWNHIISFPLGNYISGSKCMYVYVHNLKSFTYIYYTKCHAITSILVVNKWTYEQLQAALQAIRSRYMKPHSAAISFGIPSRTLYDHMHAKSKKCYGGVLKKERLLYIARQVLQLQW